MNPFSLSESRKLAELAEANAMADFYRAAPPDQAGAYGLYLEQTRSYTATLATREFEGHNRVFALGVAQPTTEEEVDHVVNLYRQAGLSSQVRLSPDAQPSELLHWLEVRGLTLEQGRKTARFVFPTSQPLSLSHPFQIHASHFSRGRRVCSGRLFWSQCCTRAVEAFDDGTTRLASLPRL